MRVVEVESVITATTSFTIVFVVVILGHLKFILLLFLLSLMHLVDLGDIAIHFHIGRDSKSRGLTHIKHDWLLFNPLSPLLICRFDRLLLWHLLYLILLYLFKRLLDHDFLHVARTLDFSRLLEVVICQQITEIQRLLSHLKLLRGGICFGQLWQTLLLPE